MWEEKKRDISAKKQRTQTSAMLLKIRRKSPPSPGHEAHVGGNLRGERNAESRRQARGPSS